MSAGQGDVGLAILDDRTQPLDLAELRAEPPTAPMPAVVPHPRRSYPPAVPVPRAATS